MSNPHLPDDLFTPGSNDPFLHMPLEQLAAYQDELLKKITLIMRASASAMYSSAWKKSGIKPALITTRARLQDLPFSDENQLAAVSKTGETIRQSLTGKPRTWLMAATKTGEKKWLPLSLEDIKRWCSAIRRASAVTLPEAVNQRRLVLAINEPLPHPANPLPYLWERMDFFSGSQNLEWINAALTMLPRVHWDRFIIKKQPQVLMSSVRDALSLAEELKKGPGLERLKKGIFWGAPLEGPSGARVSLSAAFHLEENRALYMKLECREMFIECSTHSGMHAWMDACICEIIPDGQSSSNPSRALFLDQAPAGTRGELVLTTFSDVLPLIRCRTGDRIETAGSGLCACGAAHPRFYWIE
jgi:phenylacetate-coenzyme A ligase PaaK-like adenylate-forming protein